MSFADVAGRYIGHGSEAQGFFGRVGQVRCVGVEPLFVNLGVGAVLLHVGDGFVDFVLQFLVVFVEDEAEQFGLGIGNGDDADFVFAFAFEGGIIFSDGFVDDGGGGVADLDFEQGDGAAVELLDGHAVGFGVFGARGADHDGHVFAFQVRGALDGAVLGHDDGELRFIEGRGEGDAFGPFLGHGHARGGDIDLFGLDGRNDAVEGDVFHFGIHAEALGDFADHVDFHAFVVAVAALVVLILEFEGHVGGVRGDVEHLFGAGLRLGIFFVRPAGADQEQRAQRQQDC